MTISRKALCVLYGLIGIVALLGTWGNILEYLHAGFVGATIHFWKETLVNPASRFITVDILFLGLTVIVWAVLEARRLGLRGVWLYVVFGLLIAISFTIPLFMIHRELILADRDASQTAGTLGFADMLGLSVLGLAFTAYLVLTLTL